MKINLKQLLKEYGVIPGTLVKIKDKKYKVNDDLTYSEEHKELLREDFEILEELKCVHINDCVQCPIKALDCNRALRNIDSIILKDIVNYLCKNDLELKELMLRRIENEAKRLDKSI